MRWNDPTQAGRQAGTKRGEFLLVLPFCFIQALYGMDEVRPQWWGRFSLLSLPIHMLTSSTNTLTDTPRNNVLPALWACLISVKLIPKVNHHSVTDKILKLRFFLKYLFIYLWLCWIFVSVQGLSLVVASGGHSSSWCVGLSLWWPLLLRSTGSRRAGSVIVAQGPSCSAARGIFPDQGSNLCPLHWQADSQPLRHQGSPNYDFWNG